MIRLICFGKKKKETSSVKESLCHRKSFCQEQRMLILILVSVHFLSSAKAFPNGAPDKACASMTPGHGNFQSKPADSAPYILKVNKIIVLA